ncbi:hypothetical protein EON65_31630 [archaeon]|nr:MAG: hypothetical protein EON65_31630 [archaeon]
MDEILTMAAHFYPAPSSLDAYCNQPDRLARAGARTIPPALLNRYQSTGRVHCPPGDVKYVFVTKAGPGPIKQPVEESILDANTGLPVEDLGPKHKRMNIGSGDHAATRTNACGLRSLVGLTLLLSVLALSDKLCNCT